MTGIGKRIVGFFTFVAIHRASQRTSPDDGFGPIDPDAFLFSTLACALWGISFALLEHPDVKACRRSGIEPVVRQFHEPSSFHHVQAD